MIQLNEYVVYGEDRTGHKTRYHGFAAKKASEVIKKVRKVFDLPPSMKMTVRRTGWVYNLGG